MIKGLLKRRYWWGLSDDKSECSFIWSQIKIKTIFEKQKKSQSKKPRLKKDIVDREEEYRKTDSVKRSNSIQANKKMLPGMNELFNFKVLN